MSKWQEKTKRPVLPVLYGGAGVAGRGCCCRRTACPTC